MVVCVHLYSHSEESHSIFVIENFAFSDYVTCFRLFSHFQSRNFCQVPDGFDWHAGSNWVQDTSLLLKTKHTIRHRSQRITEQGFELCQLVDLALHSVAGNAKCKFWGYKLYRYQYAQNLAFMHHAYIWEWMREIKREDW